MGLLKCCVGGCNATSDTHKLFSFPKNDELRKLWLSFLVPTNSLLIGLSEVQLRRKRVCEKHFDKHQFDVKGGRLRQAYPCLFTKDEIAHGVPLSSTETVHNTLADHSYCKERSDDDDNVAENVTIGRADNFPLGDHIYCKGTSEEHNDITNTFVRAGPSSDEQPSCSYSQVVSSATSHQIGPSSDEQPSCSYSQVVSSVTSHQKGPSSDEQPSCSYSQVVSSVTSRQKGSTSESLVKMESSKQDKKCFTQSCQTKSVMKKMASKKKKYVKDVTKIASKSLGDTAMARIEKAVLHGSNEILLKNFDCLNKQAQTFLLMQLKQCRKHKMGRRFTLDEKLIALALMKQSPKSYRLLESMFALPNKRTLNRLSEKINIEPGLNPKIFEFIKNKTKNWDTQKKLCTIVFDEISLTPHLTFNEKKDQIYGFVDVAGERKMRFCDHALVFMVRGICSSWRQSVAFYFCEGTVSAAALKCILKELVTHVAQTGLIPLGLVSDQGSTFRAAIKSLREDTAKMRVNQKIKDDGSVHISGHDLSVFFDPPHLLKGLRNNFLNKDIIFEGKTASWKDIQFIYDLDCKLGHTRTLPKLTAHHVNPDKIKKMKVSVAAQVFSARTAAMLKFTNALNNFNNQAPNSTIETTAKVVEFIDQLFDSVNCLPGGAVKGKLRKAVKLDSPHQTFWQDSIKKIKSMKFVDASSKLAVQSGKPRHVLVPSLQGWIITLESFLRLSKLLFNKYHVGYFYPRRINQDPLENFFGRIRALNCRNINPDANTFLHSFKSLLLSNILSPHSKFANCESDNGDTILDINFLFIDSNDENKNTNCPSIAIGHENQESKIINKDQAILERIKVQCSAYTAGFISRKLSKFLKCKNCIKTYTSSSTKENVFAFINEREYKMLKNNNLTYPSEKLLILYRDASTLVHNYLNVNGYKKNVCKDLREILGTSLGFSWLGCGSNHMHLLKKCFIKCIIRLHVHNWCNILNKIMKGDLEEKYVLKMADIQKTALKKYKTFKLRKKALNK